MFRNNEKFRNKERIDTMDYFQGIFSRTTFRGIADYLLFGFGEQAENISYEERIQTPFRKFEKTVEKYDSDKNSELIDLVNEVTSAVASVYAEIGLQAGLLLMSDVIQNIRSSQKNSSNHKPISCDINKTFLDELYKMRLENGLPDTLKNDKKYQRIDIEAKKEVKEIDKIKLNKEALEIIDTALCAINARNTEYGRVTYRQGFKDALELFER